MQKKVLIIIGIIILAAIIGGAFLWMQKPKTPVTEVKNNSQTADWKTYTNTEYGFEIKHPSNYEPFGPVSGPVNGQVGFIFEDKSEQSDINNTFRININPTPLNLAPEKIVSGPVAIIVDGIPAQHYKTKWKWDNKEYVLDYVEVKKGGSYYSFSDSGLKLDAIPFETILSTFKFTK